LASSRAGTTAQTALYVQAIKDSIDVLDPAATHSDVLGLAGGVMGLSLLGEDYDPQAGAFAAANSTSGLADILAGLQNANGSWNWGSAIAAPVEGDEDLQVTAYAILALNAANTASQYDDEIVSARNYLMGAQLANGGWLGWPGGDEYAETDGEILWALTETAGVPEPATMSLLALGGLALIRKRK